MTSSSETTQTPTRRGGRWWGPVLTLVAAVAVSGLSLLGVMQIGHTLKQGGWTVAGSGPALVTEGLEDGFEGRGRTNVTLAVTDTQHEVGEAEFAGRVEAVIDRVTGDPALQVTSSLGWSVGLRSRRTMSATTGAPC